MSKPFTLSKKHLWEILFQLVLLTIVFIFYSFDRQNREIEAFEFAFFGNYAIAAYLINYLLLPKFLYKKRYLQFSLLVVALIGVVIFVEEGVLEKIYFPDTRGLRFPGVAYNLVSAMPSITILAGFKFAWDALTKQQELEQLQSAVKESELQFLKSQINPHFLFNNLNNLYAYALEQSPKTPEIILELSSVLRYMLYECKEEFVPLNKEISQLQNFVSLSKLQFEDRGEVTVDIEAADSHYRIAPLILPVFIENAFKHSLSSQSEDICINISLHVNEDGLLRFECKNTFTDSSNTEDLSKGIGLANVQKRLNLLYPKSHALQIQVKEGIYQVTLELKLSKTEES